MQTTEYTTGNDNNDNSEKFSSLISQYTSLELLLVATNGSDV